MKKHLLALVTILFILTKLIGQQIEIGLIYILGNFIQANGLSIWWSIGRTNAESLSTEKLFIVQGFQVAYGSKTSLKNIEIWVNKMIVYPNIGT